ncbi:Trafficking protein particle complex subunit 3 [Operophtera brumata]|uniref:Trafficking protein particle complex subunit 3 n=1 Tax=Operophtera brumata TaxID=104452 RepID=A0A0L7K4R8_OPEBR|nr:Trafficking protein particle complex subunit 3 [Operophtera brumata]
MRSQQTRYKQLKVQLKEVTLKLKERDMQLQMLRDEHQHLAELSKDRNLLEREKLQAQNSDLSLKVQQQNETITMLQRRIALEAKNFKHQLHIEINRHKDTRADLDLAITNADKLSTIIEVPLAFPRPLSKSKSNQDTSGRTTEDNNADENLIAKICESSRNLSSVLSHDEETSSSAEPRSRYARSRTSSTTTRSRKSSKGSDDMLELAKSVQDGMAELAIFDDKSDLNNLSPDEVQKKIEVMKADLMHKIKQSDDKPRKTSALRRMSTEESIEEQVVESDEIDERPKSRGRRNSSVSFYSNVNNIEETTSTVTINDCKSGDEMAIVKPKRENSIITKIQRENSVTSMAERRRENSERKLSGKPIDKYCKDIIHDIEKSTKVIDHHVKQFQQTRFDNEHIVEQLQAVDKINELVSGNIEIPKEALTELNNNFKMLSDQVFNELPPARKRSVSGRKSSREIRSNLLGDVGMSNQDLLDDLLRKK